MSSQSEWFSSSELDTLGPKIRQNLQKEAILESFPAFYHQSMGEYYALKMGSVQRRILTLAEKYGLDAITSCIFD
jgi:hypothetical protein